MLAQEWLNKVADDLAERRRNRDAILGLRDAASREFLELCATENSLKAVDERVKALALLCQQNCKASIEELVTRCLAAVFPENRYRFNLVFERKRDQTEARIVLTDGDGNEYDPLRNNGGGVADIIAFALRLATLMLRVPQPSKVLVLDEPFRCVSADHRQRIADLLISLTSELGFQIIMVTHMRELARGNVIEL